MNTQQHIKANWGTMVCACAMLMSAVAETSTIAAENDRPNPAAKPTGAESGSIVIEKGQLALGDKKEPATLGNVIEYVRQIYSGANIVLAPGVGDIKVGDLKLACGDIGGMEAVLDALRVASGDAFISERRPSRQMVIDPATGLPRPQEPTSGEFFALLPDPNGGRAGEDRMVEVFNMGGYLRGKDQAKADESLTQLKDIVMSTISSLEPQPKRISLAFRFHPGASLLVVTGSPAELDIARKVILALPDVASSRVSSTKPETANPDQQPQAREAFMRRYGLRPPGAENPTTPGPGTQPPGGGSRF